MSSNFKRGDLVVPEPVVGFSKPPVGLVLEVGKQPDGKTHYILWVDSEGCFESWHYENAIEHYKKAEAKSEEEA
mgnify:FL=1|tara:strand:+ start:188 stop:409 length:222 start_codon:yes stop_codon:yes gene_type:complete